MAHVQYTLKSANIYECEIFRHFIYIAELLILINKIK
jgi:hypothetical protein